MAGTTFNTSNWDGYDTHSADVTHASSSLTDFSLVVDVANLSSTWKSNVQSDGADIRCTDESDTELPYDLIDWAYNAGSPTGLIRVKRSLTASTSSQKVRIYAGYTSGTAVAYTASETYGSDNAYDANWVGYWPLHDANDRTSNSNDGTAEGSVSVGGAAGHIGDATDFDDSDDGVNVGQPLQTPSNGFTAMIWAYPDDLSDDQRAFGQFTGTGSTTSWLLWMDAGGAADGWAFATCDGESTATFSIHGTDDATATASTWQHVSVSINASGDFDLRVNGVSTESGTVSVLAADSRTSDVVIGKLDGGSGVNSCFDGKLQHVQLHSTNRASAWVDHEYDQTNDNAAFYGTWSWNGASATFKPAWASHATQVAL